jgi:hypothetical protein
MRDGFLLGLVVMVWVANGCRGETKTSAKPEQPAKEFNTASPRSPTETAPPPICRPSGSAACEFASGPRTHERCIRYGGESTNSEPDEDGIVTVLEREAGFYEVRNVDVVNPALGQQRIQVITASLDTAGVACAWSADEGRGRPPPEPTPFDLAMNIKADLFEHQCPDGTKLRRLIDDEQGLIEYACSTPEKLRHGPVERFDMNGNTLGTAEFDRGFLVTAKPAGPCRPQRSRVCEFAMGALTRERCVALGGAAEAAGLGGEGVVIQQARDVGFYYNVFTLGLGPPLVETPERVEVTIVYLPGGQEWCRWSHPLE